MKNEPTLPMTTPTTLSDIVLFGRGEKKKEKKKKKTKEGDNERNFCLHKETILKEC